MQDEDAIGGTGRFDIADQAISSASATRPTSYVVGWKPFCGADS